MNFNKLLGKYDLIPVILGGGINGLGLARSFGKVKIKSIIVDHYNSFSFYSKFAKGYLVTNPIYKPDDFIRDLIELGKKIKGKGFILATNDEWLIPISKNQKELEKYFYFPMSNWEVIDKCSDKKKLYEFAIENNIPHPKTIFLDKLAEYKDKIDQISFPCILKPAIPVGFMEKMNSNKKVIRIENNEQLEIWTQRINEASLQNFPYIIQEYIDSGVENLYTITTYSNKTAEIIAYSTGHKIRQRPPDAGTIISGRVVHEPDLYKHASKLIKKIGFYGIANTEFKKDLRDGRYKLIEINPRPGKWNYSVTASGINLPYLAYREAKGENLNFIEPMKNEFVWLVLFEDIFFSLIGFKRKGNSQYSLTYKQWRKSIKGKKVFAVLSIKDFMPGIMYFISLISMFRKRGLSNR